MIAAATEKRFKFKSVNRADQCLRVIDRRTDMGLLTAIASRADASRSGLTPSAGLTLSQ